jgi:hypothetical protein
MAECCPDNTNKKDRKGENPAAQPRDEFPKNPTPHPNYVGRLQRDVAENLDALKVARQEALAAIEKDLRALEYFEPGLDASLVEELTALLTTARRELQSTGPLAPSSAKTLSDAVERIYAILETLTPQEDAETLC